MHKEVARSSLTDVDRDYFLLIPSRFPPVDLYERLGPASERFTKLEDMTNPRLLAKERLIAQGKMQEDEASPSIQNWNHAPFTYTNPEGSWFFEPTVPCLEMSMERQTALAVSVRRREVFLGRTQEPPINLDMRMLVRRVKSRALDARQVDGAVDPLVRRKIGKEIIERRSKDHFDAVLFASPERPSGGRIAVLSGAVLGRAIQSDHYRYSWDGGRINRLYSFDNRTSTGDNVFDPDDLCADAEVIAA